MTESMINPITERNSTENNIIMIPRRKSSFNIIWVWSLIFLLSFSTLLWVIRGLICLLEQFRGPQDRLLIWAVPH